MSKNEQNEILWLDRARHWCSIREMSRYDVKEKLKKAGFEKEVIELIVKTLVAEKFIDEARFCKAFVHDKLEFQKWGLGKIKQALYFKGISEELISDALENVDHDKYMEKMEIMARAKYKSIKNGEEYEKQQKVLRFLASKGVSTGDSYSILKNLKAIK